MAKLPENGTRITTLNEALALLYSPIPDDPGVVARYFDPNGTILIELVGTGKAPDLEFPVEANVCEDLVRDGYVEEEGENVAAGFILSEKGENAYLGIIKSVPKS